MTKSILNINASLMPEQSTSLKLANKFLEYKKSYLDLNVITKDLSKGIQPIDSTWIEASFTPEENRSDAHRDTLSLSNSLIDEIKQSDEIILTAPMYNFSVPANLKTYFDLIARVGLSFKYTDKGPVGLLKDIPVTVIISTGGTEIGGETDHMSPYITQMFQFVGITNITIVAADKRNVDENNAFNRADNLLKELATQNN